MGLFCQRGERGKALMGKLDEMHVTDEIKGLLERLLRQHIRVRGLPPVRAYLSQHPDLLDAVENA